ncbi:MAG TPA: TIM-barrel domain-containing protein, partial [Candidatus Bathyarchaeia archaeon]|nr:TIM-barrel domain-containing protein [Candidatus Bathyarchaeia archaeon]
MPAAPRPPRSPAPTALSLGVLGIALPLLALGGCSDRSSSGTAAVRVEHVDGRIRLISPAATAEIDLATYRLELRAGDGGELLTAEKAGGGVFYERAGATASLAGVRSDRAIDGGVELAVATTEQSPATVTVRFLTARTLEVTIAPPSPGSLTAIGDAFTSPDDEVIYGLTERLRDSPLIAPGVLDVPIEDTKPVEVGSLNRRGEKVEMFIRPTFSLYSPFYQSSHGYGLSVAGTMPGAYDLASSDPQTLSFRFETGTRPENQRLTMHLFVGPEHATILDEYTALVGRPLVPPDWAFLNWRWRDTLDVGVPAVLDGVATNAEVVDDVTMFEKLGIPPGVYHFDRPVFPGEYGFARFAWDEERLPNPDAMLAALKRRGYHIHVFSSMWACGADPGDDGIEAQQLGYLAPGPVGTPHCADTGGVSFIVDVTNPGAQGWWRDKVAAFVKQYGIDGIKLDRGEEHIPSQATDLWADGRTGREVHNDYVTLQAKIHYDALRSVHPDGDFVLISRAGYTGTQRYTIIWGGDIPGSESFGGGPGTDLGLRSAIISQERAAFLGYPIWGSDTGGYYEFKDREVFARWLEFSAFSGIMEIGGGGTHAPWDMPTQPQYDQEMIDIYRRYTALRATLQGYIAAAARDAGASGMPIVRPLPFFDRSDPKLLDIWDEYLFGPDLLVAPVWRSGQRSRDVYLPRGSWRSYWDASQSFSGPRTITVDVPLDSIPVFVRDGATVA